MNRLTIGHFKLAREGGWEGEIRTLTLNAKVRFVPNDDRAHANAPVFRVMLGGVRIGDAWEARWGPDRAHLFYRVSLDDPLFLDPMSAALFPDSEGGGAQLVWSRSPKEASRSNADERHSSEQAEGR
jgi:uncharacterized protein (DUF736 family)